MAFRQIVRTGCACLSLLAIGCAPATNPAVTVAPVNTPYQDVTLGDVVVHPSQSTLADDKGWRRAVSTRGDFSVEVPGEFVDKLIKSKTNGKIGVFHTVAATTDNLEFSALRVELLDDLESKKSHLDELLGRYHTLGASVEREAMKVGDIAGERLSVVMESASAELAVFDTPNGEYILTVEGKPEIPEDRLASIDRFFQSVRIGNVEVPPEKP